MRVRDSCVRLGTRRRCGSRAILAVETLLPRKPAGARFRALPTSPGQRLSGRIRRGARRTHRYPRRFHRSARSSHPNLPETRADLVRALASARDIRATLRLTETFAMSATALSLGAVPGTALRRSDSRRRYKTTGRRAVRVSAAIAQPVAGKVSSSTPATLHLHRRVCYPLRVTSRPSTSADSTLVPELPRPRSDSTRPPRSTSAATTAWRPTARSTCSAWSTPTGRAPSP